MNVLIYELAIFTVPPEQRDVFVDRYKLVHQQGLTNGVLGRHRTQIMKCIEEPNRVAMLIEWESAEARQRSANAYGIWTGMEDANRILHCLTVDADS